MQKIGERLRSIRERKRLTQENVADRLGLTPAAYQHYEAGRALPGMADVPRLAQVLGVTACELFSEEAEPAPIPSREDRERPARPTGGQQVTAAILRQLEGVPEEDLLQFFDFLEWQRERGAKKGTGGAAD